MADEAAPPQSQQWVLDRVQQRLALHGSWDQVAVSDASLGETGQWLFRIARGSSAQVFAIPAVPSSPDEVDGLVDEAVATVGPHPNGSS